MVLENVEYPARLAGRLGELTGRVDHPWSRWASPSSRAAGRRRPRWASSSGPPSRARSSCDPLSCSRTSRPGTRMRGWAHEVCRILQGSAAEGTCCLVATHNEEIRPLPRRDPHDGERKARSRARRDRDGDRARDALDGHEPRLAGLDAPDGGAVLAVVPPLGGLDEPPLGLEPLRRHVDEDVAVAVEVDPANVCGLPLSTSCSIGSDSVWGSAPRYSSRFSLVMLAVTISTAAGRSSGSSGRRFSSSAQAV